MDLLSRIAILGAVAASVSAIFAATVVLPQLHDPFRDIVFTTERDSYRVGEKVVFILANNGDQSFVYKRGGVNRVVDDEWTGVQCEVLSSGGRALHPGREHGWSWLAESVDPTLCPTLPVQPVEPGMYRGVVYFSRVDEPRRFFFAEFHLT